MPNAPEPTTLISALLGVGLAGVYALGRRRRGKAGNDGERPTA